MKGIVLASVCCIVFLTASLQGADDAIYRLQEDLIYGRKPGLALTMDVFSPEKKNGGGVIFVVSGGWFSNHDTTKSDIVRAFCKEMLKRGYIVFAVVHGSQPKYTIPEILEDMHRSVRYIRAHAADFGINPNRIG